MGNLIKGIFLAILAVICAIISISCAESCFSSCREKERIKNSNTNIVLLVDGPEYSDDYGDGRVVNRVAIGFKNVGKEVVYRVTCKISFYDYDGEEIGSVNFNYDPAIGDEVKYGESTSYYVKTLTNKQGKIATRIKITDLKVNGLDKTSGYE